MSDQEVAYWLARIRRELEAAGLPVERLTVMRDDVRPASPPPPRPAHTLPLLEERADVT